MKAVRIAMKSATPMRPTTVNTPATAPLFEKKDVGAWLEATSRVAEAPGALTNWVEIETNDPLLIVVIPVGVKEVGIVVGPAAALEETLFEPALLLEEEEAEVELEAEGEEDGADELDTGVLDAVVGCCVVVEVCEVTDVIGPALLAADDELEDELED
jgi:hypothetical protein